MASSTGTVAGWVFARPQRVYLRRFPRLIVLTVYCGEKYPPHSAYWYVFWYLLAVGCVCVGSQLLMVSLCREEEGLELFDDIGKQEKQRNS